MVAKPALHHLADAAGLEGECGIGKRLDHGFAAEKAQVAALGRRARILRVLLGQFGKALRLGLDVLEQVFGLLPGCSQCRRIGFFVSGNQDMAGAARFRLAIACAL